MPRLVAFGVKWKIASDDLVFPFIGSLCNRAIWIAIIGILLVFFSDAKDCSAITLLRIYLIAVVGMHGALIIVEMSGCIVSSKGTISNAKPRRFMYIILYVLLAGYFVEFVWDIIGFVWAYDPNIECPSSHTLVVFMRFLLVWNSLASIALATFLFVRIGICRVLCLPKKLKHEDIAPSESFGGRRLSRISSESLRRHLHRRNWQWRIQTLFCFVKLRDFQSSVFNEVAATLSDALKLFRGYAPSDILAGLLLVFMNRNKESTLPVEDSSSESAALGQSKPLQKSCSALKKIFRFYKHSNAIYGYPGYVKLNKFCGTLMLLTNCGCGSTSAEFNPTILGDNKCKWNTAALLKVTGMKMRDLIYVQFKPEVYLPAFYVAADHKGEAIILSIRGTKGLQDILTDLAAQPSLVSDAECEDFYAHTGCLEAARTILFKLNGEGILETAFEMYPQYRLFITGHGLGAGTAVLLSILLRPVYGNLHCYAFSPPGGLLSNAAVAYTRPFTTTVILGDAILPRLSIQSMEEFGERILEAMKTSKVPKFRIFIRGALYWLGWRPKSQGHSTDVESADMRSKKEHAAVPLMSNSGDDSTNSSEDEEETVVFDRVSRKQPLPAIQNKEDLYLPGMVLHIQCKKTKKLGCLPVTDYSASWTQSSQFSKIEVSSSMWSHHIPKSIHYALHKLAYSKP